MDYRKIFLPPVYDNLERSQKAAFLHYTLIICAAALLIFGLLNLSWNAITLGWLLLGISGFCIVGIVLNKTNRYNLAAILFSALIFIAIFYNLIDGAAFHDPGIAALPIFLILVSILFNRSAIPYFSLATILGVIALYLFWMNDLLILSKAPTLNRVLILTLLQIITGLFSWMIVSMRRESMEKLDWSKESFHALFMAAPLGIGVTSLDGRILIYNESLIKMGGWTPDEFKLMNVQDYYANPEDRIEMLDILEATGVVRGYETQFSRKDKSIFYVNMSVIPIKFGAEDALLTIIENISERKQAELEKQNELEFRRLLVDSSPIFFTVVNRQGQTTMMNKSMLEALGYEWKQIQEADYIKTFVPEREQSAVLKVIEGEFAGNKTAVSENHILTNTGQELLVEWHACPITNSEDKIEFIFAYGVDITERKKAEKELQESEEKFYKIFMESPYSMTIARLDDGVFVDVNEGFEKNLGYSREEIIGRSAMDLGLIKDPYAIEKMNRIIAKEGGSKDLELIFLHKDGQELISLVSSMIIELNGEPHRVTVGKDITGLRESERALVESELRYRMLFEYASDAIFIIKGDRVIDCNNAVLNNFGYTREEIIGKHPGEASPSIQPDGQESTSKAEALHQKVREGFPQIYEWVHQRKDGSEFTAEVNLHQVVIQDETLTLAIVRDVTERKLTEQAAREERQRLARDLHDAVSQTLWSASLIAEVLPDVWEQDPNKGLERLVRLRQLTRGALAEMRALLLELRPMALIETKMAELLNRLVEATTSRSGAQISMDFEGECDLPEDVHVALYRIAQEALNNATRHAMATEIKIRLQSELDYARLEIVDNGRGFEPEDTSPGQHLGLKIMRERASTIGATLDIISQSDEGTQVILNWTGDGEVNDG